MKTTLACLRLIIILFLLCSFSRGFGQISGIKTDHRGFAAYGPATTSLDAVSDSSQTFRLGVTANFVLFTIAGAVGNTGESVVTGNIGTNVGALTGFGLTPAICARHIGDEATAQASVDLMALGRQIDSVPKTALHGAVLGNGETLYSGVYSIAAAGSIAGVLTLDGQGNPDAVFIFTFGGAFTTGAASTVNLVNGASSCNVFWKADGAIAMAAITKMKGTLIANGAISMAAGGTLDGRMFSLVGAATVDAVTAILPACSLLTTTWNGSISTDWNNDCNWLYAQIPTSNTDIFIPGGLGNYPLLASGTGAGRDLTIQTGGSLVVSNALLKIAGTVSNSGAFTAGNGTIEMNGSTEQTIPSATFTGNEVKGLTINNVFGVNLEGQLSIVDVLTISNGHFVTGEYLTLRSTDSGTARVATISSIAALPISGNITVERYVPGRRKYRLITSSVTTSDRSLLGVGEESLSIWGNWQNSGINTAINKGNIITGGTQEDGFDLHTTNPSLFTYDEAGRRFVAFSTANGKNTKSTSLKAGLAYYMFIYGDRVNSIFTSTPNNTVLTPKGTLLTGDQTYNQSSEIPLSNVVDRFTLLGNPFASPVDWATIPKANIADTYWGWDPNLSTTGGYLTVSTLGNTTLISPFSGVTGLNQYIQPGQGFFVKTTAASPSMVIREQDKVSTFNPNAFRTSGSRTANNIPLIAVNLWYESGGNNILADGTLAAFDPEFSTGIGKEDATKLTGNGEGVSILNSSELLSIDGRPMPSAGDTILLNMLKLTKQAYILEIFTNDFGAANLQPYLEDAYLHTSSRLSTTDTNRLAFGVNPAAAASFDVHRFRITFKELKALSLVFSSIIAVRKTEGISVEWHVSEQVDIWKYVVERSGDGIHFFKVSAITARGNTMDKYTWLDNQVPAGDNYYRVAAMERDGKHFYSRIVVVKRSKLRPEIRVYPNPVLNRQINLHLLEIEKGKYTLSLHNSRSQLVLTQALDYAGGTGRTDIPITQNFPPGIYYLQLSSKRARYTQVIEIE